ncbi:SDR family oxidoreductase [Acuticoccus sp.]|uniref:SDR family oxidoreductase n=1 Tax=Acuticoccus sp. TaxID=1904378 RepID=UPI003B52FF92
MDTIPDRPQADLNGRCALVTGASRGIGEAAARALAAAGASVALAARSLGACERIAEEIEAEGGRASAVACDVADMASVQRAVDVTAERLGPVDILVNNAGLIEPIARLLESDPDEWGRTVDVNLKGTYHAMRAVLPGMLERGRGIVINISSGAATSALEGWSHYCATKAGLLSLTRCAHKELEGTGVRVVGLSPGTVATSMQVAIRASGINPVSQLDPTAHIAPSDAGAAIVWLTTDAARDYDGTDFALRSPEARALVGLPART